MSARSQTNQQQVNYSFIVVCGGLFPTAVAQKAASSPDRQTAVGQMQTTDRGTTMLVAIDFHDLAKTRRRFAETNRQTCTTLQIMLLHKPHPQDLPTGQKHRVKVPRWHRD